MHVYAQRKKERFICKNDHIYLWGKIYMRCFTSDISVLLFYIEYYFYKLQKEGKKSQERDLFISVLKTGQQMSGHTKLYNKIVLYYYLSVASVSQDDLTDHDKESFQKSWSFMVFVNF